MRPLVSVIIPTFNRAHFLGETLESIIAQTYSNWECIVVDDGSTDYTTELLEFYIAKDSRIKFLKRPLSLPKGANSCRNYGFEKSNGEYINWFDSDDIAEPQFLEMKLNSIEEEFMAVLCEGWLVDRNLKKIVEITLNSRNLFKTYVLWKNRILTPSILFRKSFLLNKSLFKNDLYRGQEAEFFSRFFFKVPDEKFKIINQPLFLYRQHSSSITSFNKVYRKKFKESESYIIHRNFERALVLKDKELINHLYNELVYLMLLGIENDHKENTQNILKNMIKNLIFKNLCLSFLLSLLFVFPLLSGKRSYRLEKKIRLYRFK